jgi:hypothetical protein
VTQKHTGQCLSLLFLAATKLQFLSQLAKSSIGHSMVQLATSTTMSGEAMVQGLFLLPFYQFQKVSCTFKCRLSMRSSSSSFFLAEKEHASSVAFRVFRRKLFHTSISLILQSLRPGETIPEVYRCPDQHYRRVIWGIGPYIADYPEQVLLACIVQDWCAK